MPLNLDNVNASELNTYLADKSYVEGYTPSQADVTAFLKLNGSAPDRASAPHAARWYKHIASYSETERDSWSGEKKSSSSSSASAEEAAPKAQEQESSSDSKAEEEKPAAKPAADDDDIDLFGDDDEESERAAEEERERRAQEALAKKKASGKVLIAKSMILFDVKPYDDETNMEELEQSVRTIAVEGLEWKSSKLVPVAYGIKKLQIQAVVIDDLVSIDDVTEQIEAFEDYVQSVDIASFNKL